MKKIAFAALLALFGIGAFAQAGGSVTTSTDPARAAQVEHQAARLKGSAPQGEAPRQTAQHAHDAHHARPVHHRVHHHHHRHHVGAHRMHHHHHHHAKATAAKP